MSKTNYEERAACLRLAAVLRRRGLDASCEVVVPSGPRRWRQIDVVVAGPRPIWIEVDGPNHRGVRNTRRDKELLVLARARRARLWHVAWYELERLGPSAIADRVVAGGEDPGRAGLRSWQRKPYDRSGAFARN